MRKLCVLFTVVLGLALLPASASALNFKPAPGSPLTIAAPDDVITATTTGNFNADIYDDVAALTTTNKLAVWFGQSDGTFQAAPGSPYSLNMDANTEKFAMWADDLTSDSRDDLIIQSGQSSGIFYSFFNSGTGSFPATPASSWNVDYTPANFTGARPRGATYAKIDDDQCEDMLVGMGEKSFQIGISDCVGGFTRATSIPVQIPPPPGSHFDGFSSTAVGDYNGDGDADIALMFRQSSNAAGPRTVYVMPGDGTGLFGTAIAYYDVSGEENSQLLGITSMDLDGNDFDDLLVNKWNSNSSNTITSLLGGVSGLVTNPVGPLNESYGSVFYMRPTDFDGDGNQDLGAVLGQTRQVKVALNDGANGLVWDGAWDYPNIGGVEFSANDIHAPDLNADGFPDIVSSGSHSVSPTQARGIIALISKPDVSADKSSLSFPETAVGQESAAQTVTVSVGTGPSAGFITSDVSIVGTGSTNYGFDTDCAGTIAGGDTCEVDVKFDPNVEGEHEPELRIKTPDGGTIAIPLSGVTGHEDAAVNTPDGTTWEIPGGAQGGELTFELEATGTWPVQITEIDTFAEFEEQDDRWAVIDTNNCKTTLQPGQTCEFQVHFDPQLGDSGSTLNGVLVVETDGGVLPPTFVELTGKATTSSFEVTPLGLEFGERAIGSGASAVKSFVVEPTGDGPVPFYGVELQGDQVDSFTVTGAANCPAMIPSDSSCTFGVAFDPKGEPGFQQTKVAIMAYNNNGGEFSVNVNGTAVSAEPPPPSPDADPRLTVKSAKKIKAGKKLLVTVTVRNAGDAATLNPVTLKATSPKKTTKPVKAIKIPSLGIGAKVTRKFRIPVKKNAKGKFRVKVALAYVGHTTMSQSAQTAPVKVLTKKKKK